MILCDTGPLVALIDGDDPHHATCVAAAATLGTHELLTTYSCFTEAMYLLRRAGGWRAQEALWDYVSDGLVRLHVPEDGELDRMQELMEDYVDTPMDLADASLIAAAETLRKQKVFTVDRHFYGYRQQRGQAFEIVP